MVAAEPHDLRRTAADVEQDDALGSPDPSAACSRWRQARPRSRDRRSRARGRPRAARDRGIRSPFSAERHASVAISRARVTPRLFILSRQIASASIARPIAASPRRPDAAIPSPSRMMRENASMTRKPRESGARPAGGSCWCRDRAQRKRARMRHGSRRRPDADGAAGQRRPHGGRLRGSRRCAGSRPDGVRASSSIAIPFCRAEALLRARRPWLVFLDRKKFYQP